MFSYKDTINIDKGLLINNIEEDGMIASNIFNELLNFIMCSFYSNNTSYNVNNEYRT